MAVNALDIAYTKIYYSTVFGQHTQIHEHYGYQDDGDFTYSVLTQGTGSYLPWETAVQDYVDLMVNFFYPDMTVNGAEFYIADGAPSGGPLLGQTTSLTGQGQSSGAQTVPHRLTMTFKSRFGHTKRLVFMGASELGLSTLVRYSFDGMTGPVTHAQAISPMIDYMLSPGNIMAPRGKGIVMRAISQLLKYDDTLREKEVS